MESIIIVFFLFRRSDNNPTRNWNEKESESWVSSRPTPNLGLALLPIPFYQNIIPRCFLPTILVPRRLSVCLSVSLENIFWHIFESPTRKQLAFITVTVVGMVANFPTPRGHLKTKLQSQGVKLKVDLDCLQMAIWEIITFICFYNLHCAALCIFSFKF